MANYIFKYKDQSMPNIHGHVENYEGGVLKPYSKKSHFKNIKSRYLAMMRKQLIEQNKSNLTQKEYLEALDLVQFEKIEQSIEQQIVASYNNKVNQLSGATGSFENAKNRLRQALQSKQNKEDAIRALSQMLSVFITHKNEDAIYNIIKNSKNPIEDLGVEDVVNVRNFLAMIDQVFEQNKDFSIQWFNQALTFPTEALASYIDAYAEDISDKEILELIKKSMTGTSSSKVQATLTDKNGQIKNLNKTIQTKSADIKLKNINFQEDLILNDSGVLIKLDLTVNTYATVKHYSSSSGALGLTSYSGKNSLVIPALKQIYGGSSLADYRIYNTLAFSQKEEEKKPELDKNFRIIRQDMITLFAEKYLIGFDTDLAQRIFIFNNVAYPVLSIIDAVIENAKNQLRDSDRNFGSLRKGDAFSISFSNAQEIQNEYIGKENSLELKTERIQKVKKSIDQLSSQGQLNRKFLLEQVKKRQIDGIKLFDF